MNRDERMALFRGLLLCSQDLYLWTYDKDMNLLDSSCPDADRFQTLFDLNDATRIQKEMMYRYDRPVVISNRFGLMWVGLSCRNESDAVERIYTLGPVLAAELPVQDIEDALYFYRLPTRTIEETKAFLRSLPVLSQNRCFEYAVMMHFCATGEHIVFGDLHFEDIEPVPSSAAKETDPPSPTLRARNLYAMEQALFRMVRDGDLNYQENIGRLAVTDSLPEFGGSTELRLKHVAMTAAVLFSRAAIEGGLAPDQGMAMAARYMEDFENCQSLAELQNLTRVMQDDFVTRVHRVRTQSLSNPIANVCEYIDLHVFEPLTLAEIAAHTRYSVSYLSHRFREETGMSIGAYILRRKLIHAESLLSEDRLTVREIAEQLGFCSPSYFSKQFRSVYGMTPDEWRRR